MEVGFKYYVTFQIPGLHRKPRVAVMIYMGQTKDTKCLLFHGDRQFGRTKIERRYISRIESCPSNIECHPGRVVK